jgi:hypothetical protein
MTGMHKDYCASKYRVYSLPQTWHRVSDKAMTEIQIKWLSKGRKNTSDFQKLQDFSPSHDTQPESDAMET